MQQKVFKCFLFIRLSRFATSFLPLAYTRFPPQPVALYRFINYNGLLRFLHLFASLICEQNHFKHINLYTNGYYGL